MDQGERANHLADPSRRLAMGTGSALYHGGRAVDIGGQRVEHEALGAFQHTAAQVEPFAGVLFVLVVIAVMPTNADHSVGTNLPVVALKFSFSLLEADIFLALQGPRRLEAIQAAWGLAH